MVRAVVGDEVQVEAQVDSIFASRKPVQVGLLIGKLSVANSRDSVFFLIPTPAKDGEEAAKTTGAPSGPKDGSGKKGAKGKPSNVDSSSLLVDTDWVAEHARQVSRMLVGGMDVVGIFVFASETIFKNSPAILWQGGRFLWGQILGYVVRAVATASPVRSETKGAQERLLLHISSSPRRVSCRSCALGSSFSAAGLKPCDWKGGKLLSSLHTFICSHPIDISLPVLVKDTGASLETVKDNFSAAIAAEAARIKSAVALVDGSVLLPDKVLGTGNITDSPQTVELFSYLDGSRGAGDIEGKQKVAAMVTLSGVVTARAYASTREPLHQAISDLKEDIISSLKARLDLLCDEAEQALEDTQSGDLTKQDRSILKTDSFSPFLRGSGDDSVDCSISLPRRVYVPWHRGVLVCDYLLLHETLEDVKDRCVELLAERNDMDISQIMEPESSVVVPPGTSFTSAINQKPGHLLEGLSGATKDSGKVETTFLEVKSLPKAHSPPAVAVFGALVSLICAIIFALLMMR